MTQPTNDNVAIVRLLAAQDNVQSTIDRCNADIEYYKGLILETMRTRERKLDELDELADAVDLLVNKSISFNVEAPAEPLFTPVLEFPDHPVMPSNMQFTILPFQMNEDDGEGPSLEEVVQFLIASGFPKGAK